MSQTDARTEQSSSTKRLIWRRSSPVITLLLLSPVIGEVLFGATRITTLFVLLPQVGTWGCAAVIIRDLVRRRRRGWFAILLLGLALAIAEECLIQQTSLAPLPGVDSEHPYGRALGVNWVYFLWALGYESVWIVVLPIQLTELIFPLRRDEPWLKTRGLVISGIIFMIASFVAWYSWTQLYLPQYFPQLAYSVPLSSVVIALATITALAIAALGRQRPSRPNQEATRCAPGPWLVGLAACALGLSWFGLVLLAFGAAPTVPAAIPITAGIGVAALAYFLIVSVSKSVDWGDSYRVALVFGAMIASMLAGFVILKLGAAPPIDVIGKLVLNLIAVFLLARLAGGARFRSHPFTS